MMTATTIAGPRGAAGATGATPALAGGSGLDFSVLMGGVLADGALPSVTGGSLAVPAVAGVAAVPVGAILPDAALVPVATIVPTPVDPVVAGAVGVSMPEPAITDSAPVAAQSPSGLTVSPPVQPVPDPFLMPVSMPAVVTALSESQAGTLPQPQALACLVEVEAGGRRRPAAERDADSPTVDEDTEVAIGAPVVDPEALPASPVVAFAMMPPPPPTPVVSQGVLQADPSVPAASPGSGVTVQDIAAEVVAPRRFALGPEKAPNSVGVSGPSPALVAWQAVSQLAPRDRVAGDAPARSAKAEVSGTKRIMADFSEQVGKGAEAVPVDDARIVAPLVGAADAVAARTADRAAVTVAQVALQSSLTMRDSPAVPAAPTAPVVTGTQPAVVPVPVAAQAAVAMPPAMAMLQDISALLAEPATAAQPVSVAPPAVVTAVPVQSPAGVAPVATAAAEPLRQARRRGDAGGLVDAPRSVDGDVAVPVSASVTTATPALAIQPAQVAGAVPVAGAQPGAGMSAIPADTALGFHVDAARHGQELDQVARDIVATGQAGAPLSFRLDSHRLGSVAVELTQQAAGLHVRLESDDATARTILTDQQQQLVTDARVAGVRIAETSVEAPRRDDNATAQGGTATRGDQTSGQTANGQSQNGQAGGQRGQGQQPSQPAATWSRGTRTGQSRTEQPAVTPRELYA